MNCPAHLSSVTKPKLRGGPCSDPRGQPLQPENGSMCAKRIEFQQLRRYFNLLSSRLTPESGQKWLGVLSEPLNLWTTKVSHFFAILFDTPTSAATKTFPVCHGCGATGQITLIKILQAHLSRCIFIQGTVHPERNGQRKRIVRQTKELSTITGATYYGLFFLPQMPFSPLMKNTAHFAFLELSPSVEGDRDVVCDPQLYSRLTSPSCLH